MNDKHMLFEPPFAQGLLDVFVDATATKVINLINRVNGNALANTRFEILSGW